MIMELEEVMTCTHQSLRPIWKRTFKYAGTIHFNFLPAHIKTAPSFSNFKSLLIKHYSQFVIIRNFLFPVNLWTLIIILIDLNFFYFGIFKIVFN